MTDFKKSIISNSSKKIFQDGRIKFYLPFFKILISQKRKKKKIKIGHTSYQSRNFILLLPRNFHVEFQNFSYRIIYSVFSVKESSQFRWLKNIQIFRLLIGINFTEANSLIIPITIRIFTLIILNVYPLTRRTLKTVANYSGKNRGNIG